MNKEDFKTKCPLCMIGFYVLCESPTKFVHLDIVWSAEAGLQQECQDPEQIFPHIVPNKDFGTGFSLDKEFDEMYRQLAEDFYNTPERFSKENIPDIDDFFLVTQAFIKYSDYMDDRNVKQTATKTAAAMYKEGKTLRDIMEAITEPETEEPE